MLLETRESREKGTWEEVLREYIDGSNQFKDALKSRVAIVNGVTM